MRDELRDRNMKKNERNLFLVSPLPQGGTLYNLSARYYIVMAIIHWRLGILSSLLVSMHKYARHPIVYRGSLHFNCT